MASHLLRLGALVALGLVVIVGPQAWAAADKGANVADPASTSNAKAKSPGRGSGRVVPPARPILGKNLSVIPGERCAEIKKGSFQRRSSCERRPRGHGHNGRPD